MKQPVAEAGAFMMMDEGIQMETIFGDGRGAGERIFGQAYECGQKSAYR